MTVVVWDDIKATSFYFLLQIVLMGHQIPLSFPGNKVPDLFLYRSNLIGCLRRDKS